MRRFAFALLGATLLSGVAANAADLPVKAPLYTAPLGYNWTGFYVGINGGGGFGHTDWTYVIGGNTAGHNTSGGLIGGTVGYNYQIQKWVLGLEGDWDWANVKGSTACPNPAFSCESKLTSLGTLRGRVGMAVGSTGNFLLYGTGGWAWGRLNIQTVHPTVGTNGTSKTPNGWTAGGGVEWGFLPNWSAKLEYLYVGFGTNTYTVDTGLQVDAKERVNVIRAGVNYRF
ncbi:MAG TPA: outer membrane protein [Pseudolabrys sp.]|nr:outer membrane protein [Pseudolabrys sp.]